MSILDPYSEAVISTTVEAALKPILTATDSLLAPSAEYLGQELKRWLADKLEKLKSDVRRKIEGTGRSAGPVAPKIAVRIAEGYALEDDDWLREGWSGLLASAAVEPSSVLPSFADILRALSADDARLLDSLYTASFADEEKEKSFKTASFSGVQIRDLFVTDVMGLPRGTPDNDEIYDRVPTSCQNLIRLRLITDESAKGLSLTILGYKFVRASRGPTRKHV